MPRRQRRSAAQRGVQPPPGLSPRACACRRTRTCGATALTAGTTGGADMKIKIRPSDASTPQDSDWLQTDGWLAALREDGRPDPAGDGHAGSAPGGDAQPEVHAEATARAETAAQAEAAWAEYAARAE